MPTTGGYDGAGNRLSVTATLPAAPSAYSGTTTYAYDQRNELTQERSTRNGGYNNVNNYDGVTNGTTSGPGNPTLMRGIGQTFNADNQLTSTGMNSGFGYDGNGNPIEYKGYALTFDPKNRMTAYGAAETNGHTADGLRAWTEGSAGVKTYFLYDGDSAIEELNSSGAVTATNTISDNCLISRHTSAESTFYDFDLSRNVAQRLTSTGSMASADVIDAFGTMQTTDTTHCPYAFSGQYGGYTDTATGFGFVRASLL